jgi:hypothetical protein
MRRWLLCGLLLVLLPLGMAQTSAADTAVTAVAAGAPSTMRATTYLHTGARLVSTSGRYSVGLDGRGALVVRRSDGTALWRSPATSPGAYLYLSKTGQLAIKVAGRIRWETRTAGSGARDVLTMRNDGVLALTSGGLIVWTTRLRNGCPARSGKAFVVDLSAQSARMCRSGQQLRATWVTTGASALGNGTPTGTWHVYAKTRNTTLYPAAGGSYPVKYWMPYSGAYGVHDSPWQKFAYGSSLYRTRGSHGCVHVPGPMMAWLYAWAPVGTTVTVHR